MILNFQLDVQSIPIYISIFSAFIAAFILFLGKIISDIHVERNEKIDFYMQGIFFAPIYIILPLILVYSYFNGSFFSFFDIKFIISIIFQLTIMGFLGWNTSSHVLKRLDLTKKFENDFTKKMTEIKESGTTLGKAIKSRNGKEGPVDAIQKNSSKVFDLMIKIFGSSYSFLIYSIITIFCTSYFFVNGTILTFGVSSIFTFYIITFISISYGHSKAENPYAEITMDDDSKINGKIMKFNEYFTYILKGNEKIFINSNKIKIIKESLFKDDRFKPKDESE